MKELKVYEFQAKDIENALRQAANALESHKKETCMDRNIVQALQYIRNVLTGEIEQEVRR